MFALSLPFCVTPFWQELTQRGHEGSSLTSAVFSDTCARCARGEEEEYVMGGASLHKQALQEALSFLSPNGGSALTKTTARLSPAGNQFFVYCRHVLVLHVHDAVKLLKKKKGPYHRGLKKNKESPPAECSNCVVFSSFCRVLASLAHLSVIWLCSVMFSTHRELSKQEAMMDCLWQKGLVRTSSSDSLAALQWCDTDHFQNQKYNCGVEVLLI